MAIFNEKEFSEQLAKQPPLSRRDAAIWLIGMVPSAAGCAGIYYFISAQEKWLQSQNQNVFALQSSFSILWGFPALALLFTLALYCLIALAYRCALFGKEGEVYCGSTHPLLLGYPLFMDLSEAPEPVVKRVRKERLDWIRYFMTLALSLVLLSCNLQGRIVLMPDGQLTVYSGTGAVKEEYGPEDIDRFLLRISEPYSGSHGSQEHYELDFMVRFKNGQYYTFSRSNVQDSDYQYYETLLALKNLYGPDAFRMEGEEILHYLCWDHGYTGPIEQLVYRLCRTP